MKFHTLTVCSTCCVHAVTVFLSLHEFPRDYDYDDDERYSTIGLLVRRTAADTSTKSTAASSVAADWEEGKDDEDDYGDRKVRRSRACFYARQHVVLSVYISYRNAVCPSVCLSVPRCHGPVPNQA